jgi:hypothetical protein
MDEATIKDLSIFRQFNINRPDFSLPPVIKYLDH